jgi:hypothetical protein
VHTHGWLPLPINFQSELLPPATEEVEPWATVVYTMTSPCSCNSTEQQNVDNWLQTRVHSEEASKNMNISDWCSYQLCRAVWECRTRGDSCTVLTHKVMPCYWHCYKIYNPVYKTLWISLKAYLWTLKGFTTSGDAGACNNAF